jgi:hypothetical protein
LNAASAGEELDPDLCGTQLDIEDVCPSWWVVRCLSSLPRRSKPFPHSLQINCFFVIIFMLAQMLLSDKPSHSNASFYVKPCAPAVRQQLKTACCSIHTVVNSVSAFSSLVRIQMLQ